LVTTVNLAIGLSITMSPAKSTELIEKPSDDRLVDPKNHTLDRVKIGATW